MLQHINKKQFLLVGKARDIKLALAAILNESKQNQTLQHYLLQRPDLTIKLHLD